MENYKQWMEQKLTSEDMDKLPKVVKPLSYDELEKLAEEFTDTDYILDDNDNELPYDKLDWFAFAKAIEKAHGIV